MGRDLKPGAKGPLRLVDFLLDGRGRMLKLANITKSYVTANFEQVALDDVSISFRENEFVAVLGPSGSGKTTLLNVVGGLDRYDSGDLIIDGVSTDDYTDRDWDTYRNNRVGFIFQSYNLIPHQSILANVELALTLTGVSRSERRARALSALDEVGLLEHARKRPSQMSGGQMQRVAIARALINDPEIVLADEPTGALDTETSAQIMALLMQIAANRLVIMVTHNPELAEQYATRTVSLLDGKVVSDTDPYLPADKTLTAGQKVRRTSMSLLTAISLSFNNLMTKKGRTLMTAFAGSIGIIGIAAILALATGVQNYIKDVEEDMLSVYPLSIQKQGMDMAAMMAMASEEGGNQAAGIDPGSSSQDVEVGEEFEQVDPNVGTVQEIQLLGKMASSIGANDLRSLKAFFDDNGGDIDSHVSAIQYYYDVTPQIFAADTADGVRQVNPDNAFSALGMGEMPSFMGPNRMSHVFQEMVEDSTVIESQYDVVAGRWPQQPSELLVVLAPTGGFSDFMLYSLGLLDPQERDDMFAQLAHEESVTIMREPTEFTYQEILDRRFSLVPSTAFYEYDEKYEVWTDRRNDTKYMESQVEEGLPLKVAGIVQPRSGSPATALPPGLYYTPMLTNYIIKEASTTEIVQQQLAHPKVNVFTGQPFDDDGIDMTGGRLDLPSMINIDESAIQNAFSIDESMLQIDPAALGLNFDFMNSLPGLDFDFQPPPPPALDLGDLAASLGTDLDLDLTLDLDAFEVDIDWDNLDLSGIDFGVDADDIQQTVTQLLDGYKAWAELQGLDEQQQTQFVGFAEYLETDEAKAILDQLNVEVDARDVAAQIIDQVAPQLQEQVTAELKKQLGEQLKEQLAGQLAESLSTELQMAMGNYMGSLAHSLRTQLESEMGGAMGAMQSEIAGTLQSAMGSVMGTLAATLPEAMSIDEEAFLEAFDFDMSEEELQRLLVSLMGIEEATYQSNIATLGYADFADPSGMDIFPIDFQAKGEVVQILEQYNADQEAAGDDEKVVTFTDIVGALMSSVTDIVNVVTYVLIAFVAISLVVSSIMIGVITYISVLERRKEIGILRSIGASKRDIRTVFNAETLIIGFTAGLLGVGITYLMTLPANAIVYAKLGIRNVAQLSPGAAAILVLISTGLTMLAGLIPASAASRRDPVEALRSD